MTAAAGAGSASAGPIPGSDDEALIQALRNLWPILNEFSRKKAVNIVNAIQSTA